MNNAYIHQPAMPAYSFAPQPPPLATDLANAHAAGDFRFNMKNFDRAGMSRGAGQAQQAGIQGAKNLADGIANAYNRQATDAASYSQNAMQAEQGQEQFSQALGALQQQNAYANAMAAIQRMSALRGLMR